MDETYKRILAHADEFFASVMTAQPQNLQCGRGCSLCCYGLFEIDAADVPMIADGLAKLHPMRRKKIIRRATEKEQFFDRTAPVACPNLSDRGECMIYESRPLVCRTFGLPLREGDRYIGDICELNFNDASSEEKVNAAWDLRWEDELGPDQYTIPEAIVLIARLNGW
jgi:Fe-S-cluster containining protein